MKHVMIEIPFYISRRDAIINGMSRYFTGLKCKKGHISERSISNGSCCECQKLGQEKINKRNSSLRSVGLITSSPAKSIKTPKGETSVSIEQIRERRLYFNNLNKDKIRAYAKLHYSKNVKKVCDNSKARRINKNLGISYVQYNAVMQSLGNVCDICGTVEADGPHRKFCLDHCHSTGQIRGILCNRCNTSIGKFEDSVALLESAILYLKSSPRSSEIAEIIENTGGFTVTKTVTICDLDLLG